jgi:hypothetical protein
MTILIIPIPIPNIRLWFLFSTSISIMSTSLLPNFALFRIEKYLCQMQVPLMMITVFPPCPRLIPVIHDSACGEHLWCIELGSSKLNRDIIRTVETGSLSDMMSTMFCLCAYLHKLAVVMPTNNYPPSPLASAVANSSLSSAHHPTSNGF